ncbi:putative membrane protein [Glaesserella parasuis MN-H]|nr:putative membrane protein [Glaesserella parasuis MN-H]
MLGSIAPFTLVSFMVSGAIASNIGKLVVPLICIAMVGY